MREIPGAKVLLPQRWQTRTLTLVVGCVDDRGEKQHQIRNRRLPRGRISFLDFVQRKTILAQLGTGFLNKTSYCRLAVISLAMLLSVHVPMYSQAPPFEWVKQISPFLVYRFLHVDVRGNCYAYPRRYHTAKIGIMSHCVVSLARTRGTKKIMRKMKPPMNG